MDNKKFEHLIQSKLKDHEAEIPSDGWAAIEKGLQRHPKVIRMRPYYRYFTAGAAALVGIVAAYTLLFYDGKQTSPVASGIHTLPITPAKDIVENPISKPKIELSAQVYKNREKPINNRIEGTNKERNDSVSLPPSAVSNFVEPSVAEPQKQNETVQSPGKTESDIDYQRKLKEFEKAGKASWTTSEPITVGSRDKGIALNLMTSNALPRSKSNANSDYLLRKASTDETLNFFSLSEPLKYSHKMPISFGLTVEKSIAPKLGIETGIVYSLLLSDYETSTLSRQGKQELHYLGIPLNLVYRFARVRNFSFYSSLGGRVDFNISGRMSDKLKNGIGQKDLFEKIKDNRAQWSFHLKAGASYAFYKKLEVYVEPGVAYYVDNKSEIHNIWKDKPINFALQIGLRSNF